MASLCTASCSCLRLFQCSKRGQREGEEDPYRARSKARVHQKAGLCDRREEGAGDQDKACLCAKADLCQEDPESAGH